MKTELETLIDQMINKGILLEEAIKDFEKKFILSTLNRYDQNLSKSAAALGIHRNTLSKRLNAYHTSANFIFSSSSKDFVAKRKDAKSSSRRTKK